MTDQVPTYDPIGYDGLSALMEECKLGMGGYVRVENYESLSALLAQLEQQTQWISVEERLPEVETDVLAWVVKGGGKRGVATAGLFFDVGVSTEPVWMGWEQEEPFRNGWKVTHWMPLPSPPTP